MVWDEVREQMIKGSDYNDMRREGEGEGMP